MSPGLKRDIKEKFQDTPLCRLFGLRPQTIVLQFLFDHQDRDYTRNELMKETEISRTTLDRALPALLFFNIIEEFKESSRFGGSAKLYKFNADSKIAELFVPFQKYLINTMKEEHDGDLEDREELSGITID